MRSFTKSPYCEVCGKSRRWGDHTECSKKLQQTHKHRSKSRAALTKNSEAYFAELLKRIGD
jgi:hypothetical protein